MTATGIALIFDWRECEGMSHIISGQIITTSAEVTLNGGLIRELPQNPFNSGLGTILICPGHMCIAWKSKLTIQFNGL